MEGRRHPRSSRHRMPPPEHLARVAEVRKGQDAWKAEIDRRSSAFQPSPEDIIMARKLVALATQLPVELVNRIIDFAEYWVCSTSTLGPKALAIWRDPYGDHGTRPTEDRPILRTKPLGLTTWSVTETERWRQETLPGTICDLYSAEISEESAQEFKPSLEHPCRKIVFDVEFNYSTSGGDEEGMTIAPEPWFVAGLQRLGRPEVEGPSGLAKLPNPFPLPVAVIKPLWPSSYDHYPSYCKYFQGIPADDCGEDPPVRLFDRHYIEWTWLGERGFVRDMRAGDVVTVWCHPRIDQCPHGVLCWMDMDCVSKITVKVYWAL